MTGDVALSPDTNAASPGTNAKSNGLAAIRARLADYRRAPARWVWHATDPDGIPADVAWLLRIAEAARALADEGYPTGEFLNCVYCQDWSKIGIGTLGQHEDGCPWAALRRALDAEQSLAPRTDSEPS